MVLRLIPCSPRRANSCCHRHWRIKGSSNPVELDFASASLAPATGVGTTRLCRPLKRRSSRAPQIAHEVHLALRLPLRAWRSRVHRIPPRVRDDRDPPLLSERDGEGFKSDLGQAGTEIFLKMGLDRPVTKQPVGQISRPVRLGSKSEEGVTRLLIVGERRITLPPSLSELRRTGPLIRPTAPRQHRTSPGTR